jgi:hypothetical protein
MGTTIMAMTIIIRMLSMSTVNTTVSKQLLELGV